jgi:photosystem II stability/assembly factor-like uncharacterized protein
MPLLLALAAAVRAEPTWKPLPPFGGPVLALAAADGAPLLYVGTETAGPARSNNGGATWMLPAQVPEPLRIVKLVVDPRNPRVAFASARTPFETNAGVLRTLDGGATWRPVNNGLGSDENPPTVSDLAIDPFDTRKVYATTSDGFYQTRDRGASWQQVSLAGDEMTALSLAAHPFRQGVLFATIFDSQSQEWDIFKSLDGGVTWTPSSQGIVDDAAFGVLVFHPGLPDTLFALGNGWPTYVSRDGGATWTNLVRPLVSLAFGPAGTLFGAPYDANGVLKSVDGGLTWSRTGALPDRIAEVLVANGRLYAGGRLGIWVSTDNGAHWRPSSRGLSARKLSDLTESGSVLYVSFAEGALASRTGGTSWRELRDAGAPQPRIVRFLDAGPDAIYALRSSGGDLERTTLVRSTDGGATWTELARPELGGTFSTLTVDPRNPDVLYAGSIENTGHDLPYCHLARSTDGGRSWSCVTGEASVEELLVDPRSSTPYLLVSGDVFTLVKGRTRLEFRGTGLPEDFTLDIALDPWRVGTLYAATTIGVFKTTNGGRLWTRTSQGLPARELAYSVAVDPHRESVVYAGLPGRVFRSLDAGRTWQRFGNGLPSDSGIVDLLPSASDPQRLYAVSAGHGLFWLDPTAP